MSLPWADANMLAAALAVQRQAFHPTQSIWVAANAGTGKTTVLTRRILALLLTDESLEPREILALTFTRAAAAEMATRLPQLRAAWAMVPEEALPQKITAELGVTPPAQAHARLQNLHQQLQRSPPLITTLHGFAQHLLAALPAAAGLPEGFGLLDDVGQRQLLQTVQHDLLHTLPATLTPYLGILLDELGEHGWADLTNLTLANWWRLEAYIGTQGVAGIGQLMSRLAGQLALPPEEELWRPLQPTPAQATELAACGLHFATESAWTQFLLTQELTPRARPLNKAQAAGFTEAWLADLAESATQAAQSMKARKAWRGLRLTEAALVWAATVKAAYTQAKQQQGLLDFADLLNGLQQVLQQAETNTTAAWLWHRLDRRFKHLVVDEAQDNNQAQGAVVQWLAKQLLAGEVGATPRTVLAVGDVKQSVYRFQGAQPAEFYALRDTLAQLSAPQAFQAVALAHTFRNGAQILALVNAVFAPPPLAALVQGAEHPWPVHQTVVPQRPSRVEVWPLVAATPSAPQGPPGRWPLAPERVAQQQPSAKLQCLQQVVAWLQAQVAAGVVLPSTALPLQWADVLIITRTNATARLMAGLLRRAGIPLSAPRGESPPPVQDVVALLRVAFNAADNLALAQVLKGLEGWDDAKLLALAAQAQPESWLASLPAEAGVKRFFQQLPTPHTPPELVQAAAAWWGLDLAELVPLLAWAEAATAAPHPALGPLGSLVQRLEEEELPVVPSVGVRVLTLHTAKGLEAPLVIIPDAGEPLLDLSRERLLWGAETVLFRQGRGLSNVEDTLLDATAHHAAADRLRALYVALTRAADWLVITGWEGRLGRAQKACLVS